MKIVVASSLCALAGVIAELKRLEPQLAGLGGRAQAHRYVETDEIRLPVT